MPTISRWLGVDTGGSYAAVAYEASSLRRPAKFGGGTASSPFPALLTADRGRVRLSTCSSAEEPEAIKQPRRACEFFRTSSTYLLLFSRFQGCGPGSP